MIITSPTIPNPVFNIICAISYSPVISAAPIPMTYMKILTRLYTTTLTAVAANGFSASLV